MAATKKTATKTAAAAQQSIGFDTAERVRLVSNVAATLAVANNNNNIDDSTAAKLVTQAGHIVKAAEAAHSQS